MKITPKIQKAINLVAQLHGGMIRKGDDLPFIVHPFAVALILAGYTKDEDVIAAGLLHDVLEDVSGYSVADMERDFGKRVLNLVQEVTEDKKPTDGPEKDKITWQYRKDKYLAHLDEASEEAMLICAADKIHNLSALLDAYKTHGEALWKRFNSPGDKKLWFYEEVLTSLKKNLKSGIVDEYEQTLFEAKRDGRNGLAIA